jgi:transcriptional regulator with XRE-family HTH domain
VQRLEGGAMPRKYAAYGKLLKYYRELGNLKIHPPWTQARIAKALGISLRTYAGWENGERLPSSDDLRNFVAVLELSEEEEKNLYRSRAQIPPEINNLPFQRNPFFTGREEHLKQLRKQLQETGTAAITQSISISGLGGIGKTQLALEYAHCYYPDDYRVALWVDADKETLQASYASLSETLGLDAQHEQGQHERVQAVKQWLSTHTNWLLIMDNSDDLPLALSFLPAKPLGHVILTTRSQIVRDSNIVSQIKVEEMEPAKEGLLFLLRRSGELEYDAELPTDATDIRKPALQLVELLGGHPLTIDQAGAYVDGTGISFTDYIKRYRAERHRLLKRRGSQVSKYNYHPEPVAATLELSFKRACEQHPLASDILHFCAFLQPDAIPEELFQYDDSFKFGTIAFDDGIETLRRYSLIKQNQQQRTFSIHRLVQAVLIDAMLPDLQKQWRERVVRALNAAFPEDAEFKDWWQCGRLLPYVFDCAAWTEDELTPTVGVAVPHFHAPTHRSRQIIFYAHSMYSLNPFRDILRTKLHR